MGLRVLGAVLGVLRGRLSYQVGSQEEADMDPKSIAKLAPKLFGSWTPTLICGAFGHRIDD